MKTISILIADDHPMVRIGLRNLLDNHNEFKVVAEAEDGEEVIQKIEQTKPAIAIIDISMPKLNGTETTRLVTKKFPDTKVIILTMLEDETYISKAIEAGASGYLLKDAKGEEIVTALLRVASGEKYFSKSAYQLIGKRFSKKPKSEVHDDDGALSSLTVREKEILTLIAEGFNTSEIAKRLFLSPRTVDTHRANIMHKLRIHSATALVRFAIDKGILIKKNL